MNKKCAVYALVNKVTGRLYIRSSTNIDNRKSYHFTNLRHNRHYNKRLQWDFNEYGIENFEFKILKTGNSRNTWIITLTL